MATLQPRDLLDMLLEGTILSSDELKDFIRRYPDEDLLFDYKDGILTKLEKRKEGSQIIRRGISGFANSVGGVLIVGVNEDKPRGISPYERNIGGQTLIEWATRCLQSMVGLFSPSPRFQIVELDEGPVLTIAVARAPSLIWCAENGKPKHFFRMGESTVEAPDYLISDLVLGRRQHPILELHLPAIDDKNVDIMDPRNGDRTDARRLGFRFRVENLSLTTAEEVAMGVIAWSLIEGETGELNQHLRLYIDVIDLPSSMSSASKVIHCSSLSTGPAMRIAPFHTEELPYIGTFDLDRRIPLKVTCAVYVLSKGAPPTWFQLEFGSLPGGMPRGGISSHLKPLIIRQGSERPKVAWEQAIWQP